jgi:hypothetical protein
LDLTTAPLPVDGVLDTLIGTARVNELVKCCQILLGGSTAAVVVTYLPTTVAYFRRAGRGEPGPPAAPGHPGMSPFEIARNLAWTVGVSIFLGATNWWLTWAYAVHGVGPTSAPGLPDELRLFAILGLHTMTCGKWAEADAAHFYPRFGFACLASVLVGVAVWYWLPPA